MNSPDHFILDASLGTEYFSNTSPWERLIRRKFMARRKFLAQLLGLPFLPMAVKAEEPKKSLKIMMKSAWGTDDPTRASFVFSHGLALSDAGHEVQIFLLADANYLMRKATAAAVLPVGWPPLVETLEKIAAKHIPIFA
jgi:hypothetical protein